MNVTRPQHLDFPLHSSSVHRVSKCAPPLHQPDTPRPMDKNCTATDIIRLFLFFNINTYAFTILLTFLAVVAERDALAISKSPYIVNLFYSFQSKDRIFLVSLSNTCKLYSDQNTQGIPCKYQVRITEPKFLPSPPSFQPPPHTPPFQRGKTGLKRTVKLSQ